jgi:RNA polymerase sigma-70 factor (ECF subfamily)
LSESSASERDLMLLAARGDRDAFGEVLARHGAEVMRVLRHMQRDGATVEDVWQETFASAFAAASQFDPARGPLRSWLFAIARNATRHRHRATMREVSTGASLLELGVLAGWGEDDPERALTRETRRELLARALASLSPEDCTLLLLRDVEGVSGEAAAEALSISLAAQKSRLHRARLCLMAAYKAEEGGLRAQEKLVAGLACGAVLARLSSYVDGELSAEERAQIDGHLRGCGVCERFGGRFSAVVQGLRQDLGAAPALDFALVERLRAALRGA